MREQARFPHCDSLVLHAPGECLFCDEYPDAQASRVNLRVNFTGHSDPDKAACPAEARRARNTINRWSGNVARKPAGRPPVYRLGPLAPLICRCGLVSFDPTWPVRHLDAPDGTRHTPDVCTATGMQG